jgi:capsular polysaccharide biosynthesis protein
VRAEPTPSGSVELRDYLAVLRRQLVVIVAVTLLGAGAAAAWSFRRTPVYESTASVLVRAITTNAFDPGQRIDQQLNMFNQRQLAQSEPVAAVAAKLLRTTATPAQLLEHVQVDVPANSQILRVRYRDTVPLTAQRGADAFAKAYLGFREADARAQAKASQTSLLRDVARLNRQVAEAERVIRSTRATSSDRQAAQARLTSLNNRLQPLNVQLNGFLSLDFTPGTVIAAAALPSRRPAPTAASTPASACSWGCSWASSPGSSATAPTTGCGVARTWPTAWTGRSWPPSRPCPGGSARAGCAGGDGTATAWPPWSSPTARPPRPTGPCAPAWPGWPASSTSPR